MMVLTVNQSETMNADSENSFTLILAVSETAKFVKMFFDGVFKNYPKKVEIVEGS